MPVTDRLTRRRARLTALLGAVTIAILLALAPTAGGATRATFYYPWFPETWGSGAPFTKYNPTLGFYDSRSASVMQQHVRAMEYGGIGVAISSWWGQGKTTDSRVAGLLSTTRAMGSGLKWTLYHEQEGYGDPPASSIASDLAYIKSRYAGDPAYLRIGDRPVIFVYGGESCAGAERWRQASASTGFYVVLKVFSGWRGCAGLVDGWHQYGPSSPTHHHAGQSFAISPGFSKSGEAERLARDLNRWQQNVREMVASGAPWQLVTTFNEWGEGTAVESAKEWASPSSYGSYLDALHTNATPGTAGGDPAPGAGGAPGPPAARAGAPSLRKLAVSPRVFRAARSGAAVAARVGTTVRYRLSTPARVRFTVRRAKLGRSRGRRCARPRGRVPKRKRCNRYTRVKGRFSHKGDAGRNRFRFRGRVGGKALRPGRYRLVARPTAAGRRGAVRLRSFRIARP
jgi:hypothetical protein